MPAADADLILALDLGTSGARAALVAPDGSVAGDGRAPYPLIAAVDGTAEQDPADWLRAARAAIGDCLAAAESADRDGEGSLGSVSCAAPDSAADARAVAGGIRSRIAALSLTGQMQDLVLLPSCDPGDAPRALAPAVLYCDTRAAADAEELARALPGWAEICGNEQDATSVAAMWRRVRRSDPALAGSAGALVLGPAGFVAWALGCGARCDVTTASTTGLLDARARAWSSEVCAAAGLDPRLLPELVGGGTDAVVGETGGSAAALLGLPADIPVVLAPGDAGATTLGIVGLEAGDDYAYLGTSGWIARVVHAGGLVPASAQHRLALPGAGDASELVISAVLSVGGAAAWARDAFLAGAAPEEADRRLEERERERGRAPSGLLAIPSMLGERFPVRDETMRAAVIGMDRGTRGIDVYAAVLEGVAQAFAHAGDDTDGRGVCDGASAGADSADECCGSGDVTANGDRTGSAAMHGGQEPASRARPLPVAGGGSRSGPWLRILADVLDRPILPVDDAEAAVIGAAIAGAEAIGREPMPPLSRRASDQGTGTGTTQASSLTALAADSANRPAAATPIGRPARALIQPDPQAARRYAADRRAHRALYDALAHVQRQRG